MKKHDSEGGTSPGAVRGRPRLFDREAALTQAMRLFWRKGYSATSLAELTTAMEISPPSLYAAFGSKELLYAEAIRHYAQQHAAKAWAGFDEAPTAREAITAYLMNSAAALSGVPGSEDPPGCMLALSAVGEEGNAVLGDLVREARTSALKKLEDRLARAVSEGELPAAAVKGRARFILAIQGGMSLQARDGASRDDLEDIARQALSNWDGHPGD